MAATAIKISPPDNVVTVLREIKAGEAVTYFEGGREWELTAKQDIPMYHKMALGPIGRNEHAFKYGESIGRLTKTVGAGMLVSDMNLSSTPRDYMSMLGEQDAG